MTQRVYTDPEEWSQAVTEGVMKRFGPETRCWYVRAATWREVLRWLVGPYTMADIENARRCIHSAGHSEHGYPHETRDGTRWWRS